MWWNLNRLSRMCGGTSAAVAVLVIVVASRHRSAFSISSDVSDSLSSRSDTFSLVITNSVSISFSSVMLLGRANRAALREAISDAELSPSELVLLDELAEASKMFLLCVALGLVVKPDDELCF